MKKQIILENRIDELVRLTSFTEAFGEEWNIAQDVVFNFHLAHEESAHRDIMAAWPPGAARTYMVTAALEQHDLALTIEDSGQPFDPTEVAEADTKLTAEERPIGGLGIFLVRRLMDSVAYQRVEGKNLLTLRKRVR